MWLTCVACTRCLWNNSCKGVFISHRSVVCPQSWGRWAVTAQSSAGQRPSLITSTPACTRRETAAMWSVHYCVCSCVRFQVSVRRFHVRNTLLSCLSCLCFCFRICTTYRWRLCTLWATAPLWSPSLWPWSSCAGSGETSWQQGEAALGDTR